MEGRIQSVDEILRILQKSEHPIEREERIRLVAERFGINQQRLIDRYPALRENIRRVRLSQSETPPVASSKGAPEERDLIYLLLHGHLSAADVRRLRPEAFSMPACRRIVETALVHLEPTVGWDFVDCDVVVDDPDCGPLAQNCLCKNSILTTPRAISRVASRRSIESGLKPCCVT